MYTLCWNCNHEYGITKPSCCPACDAVNDNIDLDLAYTEIDGPKIDVNVERRPRDDRK